jgi:hypothetical protein
VESEWSAAASEADADRDAGARAPDGANVM